MASGHVPDLPSIAQLLYVPAVSSVLSEGQMRRSVTTEFLVDHRPAIIDGAAAALHESAERHYQSLDSKTVRSRLEFLYDRVVAAAVSRDLSSVLSYASDLADQRFAAGYDVAEIQFAVNALEEAVWREVFSALPPGEHAETLALVSTIFGAAKDALAREYVTLASHTHAPSLDVRRLFAGTGLG